MENQQASAPGREVRVVATSGLKVETRADGAPPMIVGRAIVYDTWTTLYESKSYTWREKVMPGACKNALAEGQDVRCLFNHDANFVLGRTKSGTLRLVEDQAGLLTETDAPDTQLVRDLVLAPISRGDVSGMSFAFTIRPDGSTTTTRTEGERTIDERTVTAIDLFDVSPVTYPAYESTDVSLRSIGERREREVQETLPEPTSIVPPGPLAARMLARQRACSRLL